MEQSLIDFQRDLMAMPKEEKERKAQKAFNEFLKIDIDYNLAKRNLNKRENENE